MKLFYIIGGGLGHLTRFSSFLHRMQIEEPVTLIASSPFARDKRVVSDKHRVLIPPFRSARTKEDLILWLQEVIDSLKPESIYIDAFPAGILGELTQVFFPSGAKVFLLARLIKWPVYLERIPAFNKKFEKVYLFEKLPDEYLQFLEENSKNIEELQLDLPQIEVKADCNSAQKWLVIHSGPDSELKCLLNKVEEDLENESKKPQVLVVYPGRKPDFIPAQYEYVNLYPAYCLFKDAARVYSGAGFNMVDQMRGMRNKHYVMPFERILDNQFERCRQHEKEFAAVLNES
ncbi:MAG: hypothetical protein ACQETH_05595 [Candidatus Rifleibacteriota bacterium]